MGFLKSFKGKMANKGEVEPDRPHVYGESHDNKHTYQDQKYTSASATPYSQPELYAPPPGAPPNHRNTASASETNTNPPPYESWLAIPDTSQLPPPPSLSNEYSPANNATYEAAEHGHRWCAQYALYAPSVPRNPNFLDISHDGDLGFDPPPEGFRGSLRRLDQRTWAVQTEKKQTDAVLFSTLPIYFAAVSNPVMSSSTSTNGVPVTFAYSILIHTLDRSAGIAVGFACKPYPPFRLPGWHRGSLAIHSDDGNRYINDPWGGIDFTQPFRQNEMVRMSMIIHPRPSPVQEYHGKEPGVRRVGTLPKCTTQVQVERDGQVAGIWDIHEERDGEKDEGIEGLQGEADLYVAVGVFGAAKFEIRLESC